MKTKTLFHKILPMLWVVIMTMSSGTVTAQVTTMNSKAWEILSGKRPWLPTTGDLVRGGVYNPFTNNILMATRQNGNRVLIINSTTGDSTGSLNNTGITGGTFGINEMAVTTDGHIFAANLTTNGVGVRIYHWTNESPTTAPRVIFSGDLPSGKRFGDSFALAGSFSTSGNVTLYLSGNGTDKIAVFNYLRGATTATLEREITIPSGLARGGIAPVGDGTLWVNGAGTEATLINSTTGAIIKSIPTETTNTAYQEIAFFTQNFKRYVVTGIRAGSFGSEFDVMDVSNLDNIKKVGTIAGINNVANGNGAGFITYDQVRNRLIVMGTNNNLTSFRFKQVQTLPVEPDWMVFADEKRWFKPDNVTRGMTFNPATGNLIVTSRTGTPNMIVVNSANGDSIRAMDMTTVVNTNSTFPINLPVATEDGQIFAVNLAISGNTLRIYRWANETAPVQTVFQGELGAKRYGDSFGLRGSGNDVTLYFSGDGNDEIARMKWDGQKITEIKPLNVPAGLGRRGISPVPGTDLVWLSGYGSATVPVKKSLLNETTNTIVAEFGDDQAPSNTFGVSTYFESNSRKYLVIGPNQGSIFHLINVTDPSKVSLVKTFGPFNSQANANATGGIAYDAKTRRLFLMASNNAYGSFVLSPAMLTNLNDDTDTELPSRFEVLANYPNPFNPTTTLRFNLTERAEVSIEVVDVLGRVVLTQQLGRFAAGKNHHFQLDASSLASGVYLYRLSAQTGTAMLHAGGKFTLIK